DEKKLNELANKDMIVVLCNWKKSREKYRRYRILLLWILFIGMGAFLGYGYYLIDSTIPSVIHVRADAEENFDLGIPATAKFVSNIPQDAITIDLSKPVTFRTGHQTEFNTQIRFMGIWPLKQMYIRVMEEKRLIPVGTPIGIYVKAEGIMVIGTGEFEGPDGKKYAPAKSLLKSGDYIQKINGEIIKDKDSFMEKIKSGDGGAIQLTVERNGKTQEITINPMHDRGGTLKIGVWIRDNTQGVGTLTYIDEDGYFGALGHGITDVDTNRLITINDGTLYETEIISIEKGAVGHPGELVGMIVYSNDRILGDIDVNSERGIFGKCNEIARIEATEEPLPIAFKQEIDRGAAQILCTVDGQTRYYDIEITAIHMDHDNVNRGLEIKVTDNELIELTGGIVQGMSGAPIIQNNKIVGAVTHVLVQDSTRGYGIFIENMLEH
ncbi:MAG: SpoIVB peptidase, partial [Acetatifactor sp.]|nr:SpoIVB peptidase [Acetatifactor sp.]